MKIADIHSFFVRRVTSANKTTGDEFLVQASKDSLHDRENKRQEQPLKDDAVLIHSEGLDQTTFEGENACDEKQALSSKGSLDLTA
jgi:hypothetical protein